MSFSTSIIESVQSDRTRKLLGYGLVGLTGVPIDTGALWLLSQTSLHYLAVTAGGYAAAMTWNFALHRRYVFDRHGPLWQDYRRYAAVDVTSFLVRALVVIVLMDVLVGWHALAASSSIAPVIPASLAGVAVAFVVGFTGTNHYVFGDDDRGESAVARALNGAVHVLWQGRLKHWLRGSLPYAIGFQLYGHALSRLVGSEYHLAIDDVDANFSTDTAPEAVSVLHTIRKERPVLETFVADVRPDDVVWDVGANLGIYTVLAAKAGADVTAIEPFPANARRILPNAFASGCPPGAVTVQEVALGAAEEMAPLTIDRDEPGTQTPALDAGALTMSASDVLTDVVVGDRTDWPRPSVLKVDVEGGELDVLAGLEAALADVRVVYVETHSEPDTTAVRERLAASGFEVDQLHQYDQERYLRAHRPGDR